MASFNSYVELKKYKVDTAELLKWHFESVLESIFRRLTTKEKFKDPWEIKVKLSVHSKVFIEFYKAVRDHCTDFGRTTAVIRDKKGNIKLYEVNFHHLQSFIRHLNLIFDDTKRVEEYLQRSWDSGSHANVVCHEEKPINISYNIAKSEMTLSMTYEVINRYGNKCRY